LPGANAFCARCSIVPESFPMEYNITGLRDSRNGFAQGLDRLGL
jgi:hypothetical protein